MKLTKSKLKQIIKEQLMYVLNEKKYFKDFATNPRFAPDVRVWIPEHIRKNKDLWRAALQAHQNPSPTPEDTKTIQTLQQSLASFEAGHGSGEAPQTIAAQPFRATSQTLHSIKVVQIARGDQYGAGALGIPAPAEHVADGL